MTDKKIFSGDTEEEIWQKLRKDITGKQDLTQYRVILDLQNNKTILDIDIDPGGGFESGYAITRFISPLFSTTDFRLTIYKEGLLDRAGKFLGMEDVVIGYPEFDEKFIIKTNNEKKAREIFSHETVRKTFSSLPDLTLQITKKELPDNDSPSLVLTIEEGITEPDQLKRVFNAFHHVLNSLNPKT